MKCQHCAAKIERSPSGLAWVDAKGRAECQTRDESHEPVGSSPDDHWWFRPREFGR